MKVGNQIKIRMEQLGVSVPELARRIGVSGQAVRHWIAGRSFLGKRHAPALEQALSFNIDFTEGVGKRDGRKGATEIMEKQDVELMLMVSRLEPSMKLALHQLVEACLTTQMGSASSFSVKECRQPVESFFEKGKADGIKRSKKRASR